LPVYYHRALASIGIVGAREKRGYGTVVAKSASLNG
jgi:hypothetical protein